MDTKVFKMFNAVKGGTREGITRMEGLVFSDKTDNATLSYIQAHFPFLAS